MNFEIGAFGGDGRPRRVKKLLTLDDIKKWVHLQEFDEYTANGLIELASGYPTHALPSFRRNINIMIGRVRKKRQQEQQGIQNEQERLDQQQQKEPE